MVGFLGHRDSYLEPCASGERATGAGSPRRRGVGAAGFRRELTGMVIDRVARGGAPGPCSLAWYAVSAGNIRNNTIIISIRQRTLYFCPARNCNTSATFGWLRRHRDSYLEPCSPGERATGVGSPRRRGVGAADFLRYLAGIGRDRVAGGGALGASMRTKNHGVLLQETGI